MSPHADSAARCRDIYAGPLPGALFSNFGLGPHDVCYSITEQDGMLVVTFRGSADLEDWRRNVQCAPVSTPMGHVHGGFWNGVEDAVSEIYASYSSRGCTSVVFEGHSQGADHATLAAADFVHGVKTASVEVVAFAPARPGFQDFADYIASCERTGMRITAYRRMVSAFGPFTLPDAVTEIPIKTPDWNYVQPVVFNDLPEHDAGAKAFDLLYRHSMVEYARALEAPERVS